MRSGSGLCSEDKRISALDDTDVGQPQKGLRTCLSHSLPGVKTPTPLVEVGSRVRRDFLVEVELEIQQLWRNLRAFDEDAPTLPIPPVSESHAPVKKTKITDCEGNNNSQSREPLDKIEISKDDIYPKKFFCTFPFPYMNGKLHLGHGFSASKTEFAARFHRLLGKKVLWPFAFHCTGMPIAACADKLRHEIEDGTTHVTHKVADMTPASPMESAANFRGKKTKATAKAEIKTQYEIMKSLGIGDDEIPNFVDPKFWLRYFPPIAKNDLQNFGFAVDWRRSFITTDMNPYFDSFVRWQFNTLKKRGKISYGLRPTILSRLENQPCADHDRACGENACPQEYTALKLEIQNIPTAWNDYIGDRRCFLIAATLRPETVYGQTNCFVLPDGLYGLYLAFDKPRCEPPDDVSSNGVLRYVMTREEALKACPYVFIASKLSAVCMAYQGVLPVAPNDGGFLFDPHQLHTLLGCDLLGLPLSAPFATYKTVYTLPMLTISMEKGTGVVTSVPSDSPDDFMAMEDMRKKPDYFLEKHGIKPEWVQPFSPVEIIKIDGMGSLVAPELCSMMKIQSQKDREKLAQAKEIIYKKGFYEGLLIVGPHKGKKVYDAKALVRADLIKDGLAFPYWEPENRVVSRSGDICIAAMCNQWYLTYGESEWKAAVEEHVNDSSRFSAYSSTTHNQFLLVLSWLHEWACSRHYGLGSHLPWTKGDQKVLIESLSDSTIYMAYYTIAHFLQGSVDGSRTGVLGIRSAEITHDIWDYIFLQTDIPPETTIPQCHLLKMRNEFSYWYPMDLRASGKDLIFNHLTMALYNHAAMWPEKKELWPRSYYCNGHLLVDGEKMSKSAGNFLTIEAALIEFSADATRIALADAGDSLDDANFCTETANAGIMKLYLLDAFVKEFLKGTLCHRPATSKKLSPDVMFDNEMQLLVEDTLHAYKNMMFREALKSGFFDFHTKRDQYRFNCQALEVPMHEDCVVKWIECQVVILSPIAPHICEYIWSILMKKTGLVVNARWPEFDTPPCKLFHRQYRMLYRILEDFRKTKERSLQRKNKKRAPPFPEAKPNHAIIYVAKEYLPWQQEILKILQEIPLTPAGEAPDGFLTSVREHPKIKTFRPTELKDMLAFASFQMKEELKHRGPSALELRLPFDEIEVLQTNRKLLEKSLELQGLRVVESTCPQPEDTTGTRLCAMPGKPSISFYVCTTEETSTA